MEKHEIISFIQSARLSHDVWLKHGRIILDGINLDRLIEPVSVCDCEFTQWYESHEEKICAFHWYQDLKSHHNALHQSYSDLFFDSMRKYKPKTMNEMSERFDSLKQESDAFINKLDEIEAEMYTISQDSYDELVSQSEQSYSNKTESETEIKEIETSTDAKNEIDPDDVSTIKSENSDSRESVINDIKEKIKVDSLKMQSLIIEDYEATENPFDELGSLPTESSQAEAELKTTEKPEQNLVNKAQQESADTANIEKEETKDLHVEKSEIQSLLNKPAHSNKKITIKEQTIIQLQQEKEFIELELTHLEQTQKLAEQSISQLDQYYDLKQQEVELEQNDNKGFIGFKIEAKKEAESELNDIREKISNLNNTVKDLAKQNVEEELELEQSQQESSIEKQFEELKHNKNNNLEKLKENKAEKESELTSLQEQMLKLEQEISSMATDIDKQQQDILDFEEKEKIKNEERLDKKTKQEKIIQARNDTIADIQKDLDILSGEEKEQQKELETIEYQLTELNKSNDRASETNSEELTDLEAQQERKRAKLSETKKSKLTKQTELNDIETRLAGAERSLTELISEQKRDNGTVVSDVEAEQQKTELTESL